MCGFQCMMWSFSVCIPKGNTRLFFHSILLNRLRWVAIPRQNQTAPSTSTSMWGLRSLVMKKGDDFDNSDLNLTWMYIDEEDDGDKARSEQRRWLPSCRALAVPQQQPSSSLCWQWLSAVRWLQCKLFSCSFSHMSAKGNKQLCAPR